MEDVWALLCGMVRVGASLLLLVLWSVAGVGEGRQGLGLRLPVHATRESASDLEVNEAVEGMVAGLAPGGRGYVRYADLLRLPLTTIAIKRDEDSDELPPGRRVRVTGLLLEQVMTALGVNGLADLIDATCTDEYRAYYPADYRSAHHPLLVLRMEGLSPERWGARAHREDPGPYLITQENFRPAFEVLAHADRQQVPTNVVRLGFGSAAATFGAIAPRGADARAVRVQQGFAIARQNCLRCHNQGNVGGTKAGRSWVALGTWAREQPAYFERYVRDPHSEEPHAHMPANPRYDQATLAALTAYFRTFAEGGAR